MFEVGIISIIVLAVGYWVTLWLMGRHDDVLHGDFVHAEDGGEAPALPDPVFPVRPPFPPKPVIKRRMTAPAALTGEIAVRPKSASPKSASPKSGSPRSATDRSVTLETSREQPSAAPAPAAFSEQSDTLRTLLASIKRDLKDASQL